MKVYISVDIEGITGVTNWNETEKNLPDWIPFSRQMSLEALAAIEGALDAGVSEIIIKDAHDSARNIDPEILPDNVKLIRGWVGDPLSMVTTIDESFDAAIFIGYHSAGGTGYNPLAHTMNASDISYIKINDELISEYILHSYAAAMYNVPVVFVSGDKGLIDSVKSVNSNIETLAVKDGIGGATISISPHKSINEIRRLVKKALENDFSKYKIILPKKFDVEIGYKDHVKAYRLSFYPGAKLENTHTIKFTTNSFFEVMRVIHFLT